MGLKINEKCSNLMLKVQKYTTTQQTLSKRTDNGPLLALMPCRRRPPAALPRRLAHRIYIGPLAESCRRFGSGPMAANRQLLNNGPSAANR